MSGLGGGAAKHRKRAMGEPRDWMGIFCDWRRGRGRVSIGGV